MEILQELKLLYPEETFPDNLEYSPELVQCIKNLPGKNGKKLLFLLLAKIPSTVDDDFETRFYSKLDKFTTETETNAKKIDITSKLFGEDTKKFQHEYANAYIETLVEILPEEEKLPFLMKYSSELMKQILTK